jgi:Fe-Mn family superoxide dismutase
MGFIGKIYTPIRLPVDREVLYPLWDAEDIDLHYEYQYRKAVEQLNALAVNIGNLEGYGAQALLQMPKLIPAYCREEIRKHLKTVFCHEVFFKNLRSFDDGYEMPNGKLNEAICKGYGSYGGFLYAFKEKAMTVQGSGFVWALADPHSREVLIDATIGYEIPNARYHVLFCLDMWEHAWILRYRASVSTYIEGFFHILNIGKISNEYEDFYEKRKKR